MNYIAAQVSESGRLSLPAEFRRAIGLDQGGPVVVELVDREIRIRTVAEVIARSQAIISDLIGDSPEASSDALIAERRREAMRE
jgi:AbrB family looped-hinge helix DNA binding protein